MESQKYAKMLSGKVKKSFWERSESDPKTDPKKYPEMRVLGRSKTRFGDIRMASARFECIRKKTPKESAWNLFLEFFASKGVHFGGHF